MDIKVGTLNCQNSKINRTGGLREDGIDNSKLLANHIEKEGYFFLGTQELTRVFSEKLLNNLSNYKLYGNYRYGSSNLVKSISMLDSFNENNVIITNRKIAKGATKMLPWYPYVPKDLLNALQHGSIMPRIMTIAEINDNNIGNIYVINTHLDYQISNVQKRQLKYIEKIISILSQIYPVVLTGDFNMEIGTPYFDEFIKSLNTIGLERVNVNNKTNAPKFPNQTAIDHIFIPKKWQVENAGIINDESLNSVTDHKGVYADIKIR